MLGIVFGRDRMPERAVIAAALRRFLPICEAYFGLWLRSRRQSRENDDLKGALNAIDLGVVLVDQAGAACFVNAAAQTLLAEGRFVRRRGAAIHATDLRGTIRLQAAIGAAIASNADDASGDARRRQHSGQGSALLKLGAGTDQLIVAALPADRPADAPGSVAAMLIMLKPDVEADKVATPACKLFGLSIVETQLACHLVAGNSVSEASKAMRIRESTGRSYLKQIFVKTNVNRQAELVRVLLTSIIRARTRGEVQVL